MAFPPNHDYVNPADLFAFHPAAAAEPLLKPEWDISDPYLSPDSLEPWRVNPTDLTHSHQDSAVDLRHFYASGPALVPPRKTEEASEYDHVVATPFSTPASNPSNTPSPHAADMIFSNANSPGDYHRDLSQTSSPEANHNDVFTRGDSIVIPQSPDPPNVSIFVDRTKTRAETQIKTMLVLDPLPRQYQWARFPRHTLSKSKQLANADEIQVNESGNAAVRIDLRLVCATAVEKDHGLQLALRRARGEAPMPARQPGQQVSEIDKDDPAHPQNGGQVVICEGCKERERKRYDRKKKRNQEEENEWSNYEDQRIIMINEKEFKRWQHVEPGQQHGPDAKKVEFAMRITCYCRHQEEKSPVGYKVIFTFRDSNNTVLAQSVSEIIQITDDHKNRELPIVSTITTTDLNVLPPPTREDKVPPPYSMPVYTNYAAPSVYGMYSQPTTPILSQFQSPLSPMDAHYPPPPPPPPNTNNAALAPQLPHQAAFAFTAGPIAPPPPPAPAPAPSYASHQRYQSYSNTPMLSPTEQFVPPAGFPLHRPHSMDSFSAAFANMYAPTNAYTHPPFASQPPSRNVSRPASPSWDQGPSRSKKIRAVTNFYLEEPEE
ncbi:SPT3 Dosage dependent suppressor of Ty-induced promoter mutations-like protein [Pleosporales sp. CAS-2024a]